MKIRKVRKYGNTWVIALTPTDAKDNDLEEFSYVDISDVIFYKNHPKTKLNPKEAKKHGKHI